jgi:hypothetical protein
LATRCQFHHHVHTCGIAIRNSIVAPPANGVVGWSDKSSRSPGGFDAKNVIFITVSTLADSHPSQMDAERTIPIPACPSCGHPMRFARASPAERFPQLRTYDCKGCGVAVTEAEGSQPTWAVVSDRPSIVRALLNDGLLVSAPDKPTPVPSLKRTPYQRWR